MPDCANKTYYNYAYRNKFVLYMCALIKCIWYNLNEVPQPLMNTLIKQYDAVPFINRRDVHVVRAFASPSGGRGFEPLPGHTKKKMVPSAFLADAWYSKNGEGKLNMRSYQWTVPLAFTAFGTRQTCGLGLLNGNRPRPMRRHSAREGL